MSGKDIRDRTFHFAVKIVELSKALDARSGVPRTLSNQILRSGTSVGANLEEAQAGQSKADFISKASISCKEARETHYWLRLLAEAKVVPAEELIELTREANEIVAILTAIVGNARGNRNR